MAFAILDSNIQSLSGTLGDLVFRRRADGRVIVAIRPRQSRRKPTAEQLVGRQRFARAASYARCVLRDPAARAVYQHVAKRRGRTAYQIAVGEFYRAPVVELVDTSAYAGAVGDPIRVIASDEIKVVSVAITIRAKSGRIHERGLATCVNGTWVYRATKALRGRQSVTIEVIAKNLPGNEGAATKVYR